MTGCPPSPPLPGLVEVNGPDAATAVRQGLRAAASDKRRSAAAAAGGGKSAKWKQQSQQLREAMRASRMVTKAQKEGRYVGAGGGAGPCAGLHR